MITPMPKADDDHLDGCDADFTEEIDDARTAELRPLFPDGKPDAKAAALYKELAKLDA